MNIKNKNIVVTGASGLVGIPLVEKCVDAGADTVYAVDIRTSAGLNEVAQKYPNVKIINTDLTHLSNCEDLFTEKKIHVVLHCAGIKGSPARTKSKPADYVFPMMMFNTNMIKASFDADVDWFVYLSSVGVYSPADVMHEEDVWNTMPSKNDWYPGWSKRMGELALESLSIQHNWNKWSVIRPANIYGVHDNFAEDATVISSNIWKLTNSDKIVAWGDGTPRRDFVFGNDVAQATLDVVYKEVNDVINFGCGEAKTIKETIETIADCYHTVTGIKKEIVWDNSKPNGDLLRCLSTDKQRKYGIMPSTDLRDGIMQTLEHLYTN